MAADLCKRRSRADDGQVTRGADRQKPVGCVPAREEHNRRNGISPGDARPWRRPVRVLLHSLAALVRTPCVSGPGWWPFDFLSGNNESKAGGKRTPEVEPGT